MPLTALIEVYASGKWTPAASLEWLGGSRCRFSYLTANIFGPQLSVSLGLPVAFTDLAWLPADGGALERQDLRPPPFVFDLGPQGKGRALLCKLLGLPDTDDSHLPLLLAGAFNPIGRLRVDRAVDFYSQQVRQWGGDARSVGVTFDDVLARSEAFLDQLSLHSILSSGTTGVQGVAPKLLLTQDRDGLWHPDAALPDEQASVHWLVKWPRGKSEDDRAVLRNEAAYLRVAAGCGLRVHAPPALHGDMLFVRRFDREVNDSRGPDRLHRLHQESLASLAGHRGFGMPDTLNHLLASLRQHVHDPLGETIEFLKRDALNQALRNTDNHARNHALQVLADGTVRLTPLFDFAPMYLDPEVVPRALHWHRADGQRTQNWNAILESLTLSDTEREACAAALQAFAEVVGRLPEMAVDCGVEKRVLQDCKPSIEHVAKELGLSRG